MPDKIYKISEAYIQQLKKRDYILIAMMVVLMLAYLAFNLWEDGTNTLATTLICFSSALVLAIPFFLLSGKAVRQWLQAMQVTLTELGIVRLNQKHIENIDYDQITAATFYQDLAGRIKRIDLRTQKERFSFIHLGKMEQLAESIRNRLPDPNLVQTKTRRFILTEPTLVLGTIMLVILLLAWFANFVIPNAFRGIAGVGLIIIAIYQLRADPLIQSRGVKQRNDNKASAIFSILMGLLLLGDGISFWFGPCGLTGRYLFSSGCVAAYEEVDGAAFVPAGTLLLEKRFNNVNARLAPGWPWNKRAQLPHFRYVSGYFVSPDGNLFVSLTSGESGGSQVQFWDLAEEQLVYQILTDGIWNEMNGVVFTPDSRQVALATDSHVEVWDVTTWQQLGRPDAGRRAVAFHPDGRSIATFTAEGDIRWWNIADGTEAGRLEIPASAGIIGNGGLGLAFSPDGQWLAANTLEGTVAFWRLPDGALHHSWQQPTDSTAPVVFSPDGTLLAAAFADEEATQQGYVQLWQVEPFQEWATVEVGKSFDRFNQPDAIHFSPDGRTIALIAQSGGVILFDVAKLEP